MSQTQTPGFWAYVRIARPDHWIKNLFILPGSLLAFLLAGWDAGLWTLLIQLVLGFLCTCCVASANYVINEWLDAEFDRFHPTKKNRPVVAGGMKGRLVALDYLFWAVLGLTVAALLSRWVLAMEVWLLVMGLLYNVKPIRTKDVVYLDVLSESINNPIRLLIGWFLVTQAALPPSSIVVGYWFGGAFLMAVKRFAEYRMIGDPQRAGLYRRSFKRYTEQSLLVSSVFYAMVSSFMLGVFMIKYKIELILALPFLFGLFCYYLKLAFKDDSVVQKPEKLYHEKGLLLYVLVLFAIGVALLFLKLPWLDALLTTELIGL